VPDGLADKKKALVKWYQRLSGMGLRLFLLVTTNPSGHSFVISSKTNRKQNGDIWENHWNSTPRQEQFTPANPQFVPDSFRFDPFRVKIHPLWREPWLIPGCES
jgi:hypothetical protein